MDKYNHMPLYIQLKDEISNKITNGEWKVNTKIPTERELMEEYKVGRATVREAVSILAEQGYLHKKHGIGTFVERDKPSLGFEPLISLTFTLKTKGMSLENKILEKKYFNPDVELLKKLKWKKENGCLYLKRLRIVDSTPVAIESSYLTERFNRDEKVINFKKSLTDIILKDFKIKISKIDQTIIIKTPNEEEQELLGINKDTQVVYMERWLYEENNSEPFYYLNFVVPENIYYIPMA